MVRPVLALTAGVLDNETAMKQNRPGSPRWTSGFTVIELMIAVVIVGVLLAIALPSFLDSMRKGRRSEAVAALSAMQQAQERWRSNRAAYTATLSDLGLTSATTGPGGYYSLSISSASSTGYVLTADGSGSSQANDAQCAKLSLQLNGGAILYASCKSCTTFTYAGTDVCWAR